MEVPRKVVEGDCVPGEGGAGDCVPGEGTAGSGPDLATPVPTAALNLGARHDVPVLLLSASVGNRKSLERMLEGLGLSVQVAATLRAARTALHAAPHAAALIELPVPGLHLPGDLLAGLPAGHSPPMLTLGMMTLEGTRRIAHPPTPDLLRAAFAPLLPNHALTAAVPEQAQRLLLTDLMAKPGVLGVTLLDGGGESVAQQGEALPPQLGLHLITALEATRSLGGLLYGGKMHTAQLEYEHRTLLLAAHGPHVIACILRDPSTSSLIRYLLRTRLAA